MRAHIESPADLGRVVRRIRETHGWSQRRLAKALGVGQRYLHELETGAPKRFDSHYLAVLAALGVRLSVEFDEGGADAESSAPPAEADRAPGA